MVRRHKIIITSTPLDSVRNTSKKRRIMESLLPVNRIVFFFARILASRV